jgi:hypothetical protein
MANTIVTSRCPEALFLKWQTAAKPESDGKSWQKFNVSEVPYLAIDAVKLSMSIEMI